MRTETTEPQGREHPHFGGVPSFFRYIVQDAEVQRNGYDYSIAGQELARHTESLMEDGDGPGQDAQSRWEELLALFGAWDDDRVLAWYDREFPRCMALIPRRRRAQFVKGVAFAVEEGIIP